MTASRSEFDRLHFELSFRGDIWFVKDFPSHVLPLDVYHIPGAPNAYF